MSSNAPALRLDQLAADGSLPPARRALLQSTLAAGLPSGRDENWRYAQLRGLDRQVFAPAAAPGPEAVRIAAAALPPALDDHARLVFVDGFLSRELSTPAWPSVARLLEGEAAGHTRAAALAAVPARITPATPSRPVAVPDRTASMDLRLAGLNAALAQQALCIDLPAGAVASLEVLFVATADASLAASHPALQVRVASGARLQLVERHLGAGDAATFTNADVQVEVAPQGQLRHTRLQQLGPRSRHFETLTLDALDGAQCELLGFAAGALASRSTALLALRGREARLRFDAVALGDRTQVHDAYVAIDHAAPGARTEQAFRGIAAGRSRVAFNGHMIVRDCAPGASSAQSLKALLAGPEAEADVRPQLEIYVDEVRASHGATVGKLDEQMRFYLLSRGIDRDTADALLKWAFVEDVVSRVAPAALRRQVEDAMAAQLRALVDAEALR